MSTERPAALVHSYLADRQDSSKPDRLTRVGILAAAELYRHGKIDKICITVESGLSSPQVKRLKMLLPGLPHEDLVVEPETVTTRQEIETFEELAAEYGWERLMSVADTLHLPRIKREIKRSYIKGDTDIETKSSQEVLSQYPRYTGILTEIDSWPESRSLRIQEGLLAIPVLGSLLSKVVEHLPGKVRLQYWLFRQLER